MFDLEQHLHQWRQELEATLAFSSEEIDELEDHLRFSFDAKIKEGVASENAWGSSLGDLGSASALALEFAKDKLMPALWRLLVSWWRPAILLVLLSLTFYFVTFTGEKGWLGEVCWEMAWLALLTALIFLPEKPQKNAVLAGVGNAFCLIPLLHVFLYNRFTETVVGVGWSQMAASFGWLPLSLSAAGILILNVWWWKHSKTSPEKIAAMRAIACAIVLIFTLSPFLGELIGHLSIRELYKLPAANLIPLTDKALSAFLNFKFVDILVNASVFIINFQPLVLVAVVSLGIVATQWGVRGLKIKEASETSIFPTSRDLPWVMTLFASGISWVINCQVEPSFRERFREIKRSIGEPATCAVGYELMILCSAILFLIAGYELTQRLRQSSRIRLFYASMLVVIQVGVLLGVTLLLPFLNAISTVKPPYDQTSQPLWLSWLLWVPVVLIAGAQSWILRVKVSNRLCETSLWQFDGKCLVESGLLLGLIFACTGLVLWMVALDMAYISMTFLSALIAWGNSISKPTTNHFYPQDYGISSHLSFWTFAGLGYIVLCLALGLGTAMFLSALEFIRFNGFRLYKVRKIRQGLAQDLALNG